MRRVIAGLGVLLLASCASATPAAKELRPTQGELDLNATREALKIELASKPDQMQPGLGAEFEFILRNVGPAPLDLCLGPGVSTRMRSQGNDPWRVLKWYGNPTDVRCPNRSRLSPREARTFRESVVLPAGLSSGPAQLQAMLAIELPASCCSCPYGCASGEVSETFSILVGNQQ